MGRALRGICDLHQDDGLNAIIAVSLQDVRAASVKKAIPRRVIIFAMQPVGPVGVETVSVSRLIVMMAGVELIVRI